MKKLILLGIMSFILLLFKLSDIRPLSDDIERFLQSATGDVSLPSNSFSIGSYFDINYEFTTDNSIRMAIQFNEPNQYFSIGFGSSMSGSDIWVFEIVNSAILASDRVGIGYTTPPLDTDQGGDDNLEILGYEITSSYSLVKLRRALDTGDSNDAVISPGSTTLIWATGSSPTLTYHGTARGVTTVDFEEGTSSTSVDYGSGESVTAYSNTMKVHAIINSIAWLILSDIAIFIVRLFRGKKLKVGGKLVLPIQLIHGLIMLMVIIMSVVVTALAIQEFLQSHGSAKTTGVRRRDFHYLNGLVILFLILVTLLTGVFALVFLARYKKKPSSRLIIKRLHQLLGYLLYLDAKANIITGVLLFDTNQWKIPVFIYLGVLLLAHVGVQLVISLAYRYSNKEPAYAKKLALTQQQSELLVGISRGDSREALSKSFPRMKWMILGNSVYDLTNWIHPGGNFIIEACIGREVGRYFYGGHALEGTKIKPHKHSAITLSQIKSFYIGEVANYESILISKKTQKEIISKSDKTWRMISIKPISETVGQVCFSNAEIQVKNFGTSLSWLGRHFRISFNQSSSSARLYTTALALNEANIYLRQNMYNYFDDVMAGNTALAFAYDPSYLTNQDSLPFFIKNYTNLKKGLSRKIYQTEINGKSNEFRIEGPLGRGLEINQETSGDITIICAGTGILPLIDFLNVFLWKNMFELIQEKIGIEEAQQINILNMPFSEIMNGLNITFIGSFANESDITGVDIIKKLAEVSKRYNRNNFKAIIKGCSHEHVTQLNRRIDRNLLLETLDLNQEKYFVVGPPDFNNTILQTLNKFGINRQKIIIV